MVAAGDREVASLLGSAEIQKAAGLRADEFF